MSSKCLNASISHRCISRTLVLNRVNVWYLTRSSKNSAITRSPTNHYLHPSIRASHQFHHLSIPYTHQIDNLLGHRHLGHGMDGRWVLMAAEANRPSYSFTSHPLL